MAADCTVFPSAIGNPTGPGMAPGHRVGTVAPCKKNQATDFRKSRCLILKTVVSWLLRVFDPGYFEYSTSTGAVWISWNCGSGRRGGASESLVQQPQDVARTAVTQTGMASSRRIMVDLLYRGGFFLESELIGVDRKKNPARLKKAGGVGSNLTWLVPGRKVLVLVRLGSMKRRRTLRR